MAGVARNGEHERLAARGEPDPSLATSPNCPTNGVHLRAVQRGRYLTLETMVSISDDLAIGLPAMVI